MTIASGVLAIAFLLSGSHSKWATAEDLLSVVAAPDPETARGLSLAEAIRIALEHSEGVSIIKLDAAGPSSRNPSLPPTSGPIRPWSGVRLPERPESPTAGATPIVIAPADKAADPDDFRSRVTAHVLDVERHYWKLARDEARWKARQAALQMARAIVGSRLGRDEGEACVAGRDEAEGRIEPFRLAVEAAEADRYAADHRLRKLLGWEPTDDRRLIPVSRPSQDFSRFSMSRVGARAGDTAGRALEELIYPGWEETVLRMIEHHPDIVRERRRVEKSMSMHLASMNVLPWDASNSPFRSPFPGTRATRYQHLKRLEELDEVIIRCVRSLLERFFGLNVPWSLHQAAVQVREAADGKIRAGRASAGMDEVAVDSLLDDVADWSDAVADEARTAADYNGAIVDLKAAEGTVLDAANIAVAEARVRRMPRTGASVAKPTPGGANDRDRGVIRTQLEKR